MTTLLIVRHGIALEQDEFAQTGQSDDLRPLTEEGWRKMAGVAKGLARVVEEIDLLASSPLLRAVQTAEVVAKRYQITHVAHTETLRPERPPAECAAWLADQQGEVVAVVGHEPHLSTFVTWLISGQTRSAIELKKGGACLIDVARPAAGGGTLLWLMAPRQLRDLG